MIEIGGAPLIGRWTFYFAMLIVVAVFIYFAIKDWREENGNRKTQGRIQ